nr:MAG TPA: hypothetical protein [Caudoviricetes sp.]
MAIQWRYYFEVSDLFLRMLLEKDSNDLLMNMMNKRL